MNTKDIITALRCCCSDTPCSQCPLFERIDCIKVLIDAALKLIEHLTEEQTDFITRLLAKDVIIDGLQDTPRRIQEQVNASFSTKCKYSGAEIKECVNHIVKQMTSNENTCVCCNEPIPEGRQVCPHCNKSIESEK